MKTETTETPWWMETEFRHLDGTRLVRVTRTLPIEELSALECKALLSHSNQSNTPERRKALWQKWWTWFCSEAGRTWNAEQIAKRKAGAS